MKEVYDFLKSNRTFFLATAEGDQPRVRPFGALAVFEDKLYIQTGNTKPVFQQMAKNPKIEIVAMSQEGQWIRIAATAVQDDRVEARQFMLDENPTLKNRYAVDDGICEVLYLKDATAVIYSFGAEPKTINF